MFHHNSSLRLLTALLALLASFGCRLPTDSIDPEAQDRTLGRRARKAITGYSFESLGAVGTIDENAKTIAVNVPRGTDATALVATFTTTGSSVRVAGVVQVSGTTANDFSSPVIYKVRALNGSTASYTVTVTEAVEALSDARSITAFSFGSPAVTGKIDESAGTIAVTVPDGTNVTALVATFSTTGAEVSVQVGSMLTVQQSGATANDFSAPVIYRVAAADGSTASYTVTVSVTAAPPSGPIISFTVVDSFSPNGLAWAQSINNTGHVGWRWIDGRAYVRRDSTTIELGSLGGGSTMIGGINVIGQVVGSSTPGTGPAYHPFLWQHGIMTDLGTLGFLQGMALAVSGSGLVVGSLGNVTSMSSPFLEGDGDRGFVWRDGVMSDLGTLGGSNTLGGADVNEAGQVVGTSLTASGEYHAFLWQNGAMIDLGTLWGMSRANAINNLGQVVGVSASQAFLWQNGTMVRMNVPWLSEAVDINDAGVVLGFYVSEGWEECWEYGGCYYAYTEPFLWTQSGGMIRLHGLIPPDFDLQGGYLYPVGINNAGEILVTHVTEGTPRYAYSPYSGAWWPRKPRGRALLLKPVR
jgi:probable HAF family extracellular repeat protein